MTLVNPIARAALGAAILIGAGLAARQAHAGYIVTLTQVGSNVVASGSGTIDTTDLTFLYSGGGPGNGMRPSQGVIVTGPGVSSDAYQGVTGPASFGSGAPAVASSGSGDTVGINGTLDALIVPVGYVSGAPLSDTSTYAGQTFISLGVTPGSYVWTWGSGAHADSFTLDIVAAAVPEPAGLALLALPLGVLSLCAARRGRRARNG